MCCTRLSSKRTQRLVVLDEAGQRLVARRSPEGLPGIRGLHELIAAHAAEQPTKC